MMLPLVAQLAAMGDVGNHGPDAPAPVAIELEQCEQIDPRQLDRLLRIEFAGESPTLSGVVQVSVACNGKHSLVRAFDPSSGVQQAKAVDLSASDTQSRDARTRELALLIGELVRASHDESSKTGQPPPLRQEPIAREPSIAPSRQADAKLQLGAVAGGELYGEGYWHAGPSLLLQLSPLPRLQAELRLGVRFTEGHDTNSGSVVIQTYSAACGVGVSVLPEHLPLGLWLQARAEADWVIVSATPSAGFTATDENALAWVAALGPGLRIPLSESLQFIAEGSLQLPLRSVTIDDQDAQITALRGLGAAAHLGLLVEL